MSEGQITIPIEKYTAMQERGNKLERELKDALAACQKAETTDPQNRIDHLRCTLQHALVVVDFAVANLDPETVRGWPHKDLEELSADMKNLPGASTLEKQVSVAFHEFARFAAQIEMRRAQNTHKELESQPRGGGAA